MASALISGLASHAVGQYAGKRAIDYMLHKKRKYDGEGDVESSPLVGGYSGGHTKSAYISKRYPKARKRREERFQKKVVSALLKHSKICFMSTFTINSKGASGGNTICWSEVPIMCGFPYTQTNSTTTDADNAYYWYPVVDGGAATGGSAGSSNEVYAMTDIFANAPTELAGGTSGIAGTQGAQSVTQGYNPDPSGWIYGYNIAMSMYNPNAYGMTVTLYECSCIRTYDSSSTNYEYPSLLCGLDFLSNTEFAYYKYGSGLAHTGGGVTYQTPGFTPLQNASFGKYFKVTKAITHQLDAGQTMDFERHYKFPRLFRRQDFETHVFIQGLSKVWLIAEHPTHLTNSGETWHAFGTTVGSGHIHGMIYRYTKRFMVKPNPEYSWNGISLPSAHP